MGGFLEKFKRILATYLVLWLALACALSCWWKDIFGDAPNPFLLDVNRASIVIAVAMLAVGSLLCVDEVKGLAKTRVAAFGGACVQFLAPPTLAFIVAKVFHLEGAYFIGVMATGCAPCAMEAILLTHTARGNASYSVGLTALATLLAPLVAPSTLGLFFGSAELEMDYADVMTNALMTLAAPIALGCACSQRWRWWRAAAARIAELVVHLAIIWIIASVAGQNCDATASMSTKIVVAALTLSLVCYLSGYIAGVALRLTPGMRRALTFGVGVHNAWLALALCARYFGDFKEASLFCAAYSVASMTTGTVLSQTFRFITERAEREAEKVAADADAQG